MSQSLDVLMHLKSGKTLTPIDALNEYGCFRLGARILELRKQGYKIKTETPKKGKQYAIYSMEL